MECTLTRLWEEMRVIYIDDKERGIVIFANDLSFIVMVRFKRVSKWDAKSVEVFF